MHRCPKCPKSFNRPNGLTRHLHASHGSKSPRRVGSAAPTPGRKAATLADCIRERQAKIATLQAEIKALETAQAILG